MTFVRNIITYLLNIIRGDTYGNKQAIEKLELAKYHFLDGEFNSKDI
jgi:hypothetical protein